MKAILQCLSHTPIKGYYDPAPDVVAETESIIATLSEELRAFDPELVFLFAPDHYNGFFLDTMPQFCIGMAAEAVGDYGTQAGPLDVPRDIAEQCANHVVSRDIDLAISYRMQVDHGFSQPLQELLGDIAACPVVPIFINSVAPPLASFRRARLLGQAVGEYARTLDKRVAFIGSGGLSHNPPVPQISTAAPDVAERIINGRNPTEEARDARQVRTVNAAREFAEGRGSLQMLNPEWDQMFMGQLTARDWDAIDATRNDDVTRLGGASAHEVKAWVAAAAAMQTVAGEQYRATARYYRAIPEWIAGFGVLSSDSVSV